MRIRTAISLSLMCAALATGCSENENKKTKVLTEATTLEGSATIEETTILDTTAEGTTTEKTLIEETIIEETIIEETPTMYETETKQDVSESETSWSPSSLMNGLTTGIEYDKKYNAVVNSSEDAWTIVKMFGDMQKKNYSNPDISEIETQMEEEFNIAYVALGELDIETAQDVYSAFNYMYESYPELYGTLTDFSLGNFTWNGLAETRTYEFVTNNNVVPIVLKREIIINASFFLNRENLLSICADQEASGFWPSNASISMIIVHELGHHLLDVHNSELHGFSGNYVTSDNHDAYRDYAQESLTWNQAEVKRIISSAYAKWSISHEGSEEDFRGSISEYALGIQSDGGISYSETFAEAIADIYANGDGAAEASRLILETFYSGT